MNRLQRFFPMAIAAAIAVPFLFKGHGDDRRPVAFVREDPGYYVKISGSVKKPGIYRFVSGTEGRTVNQLTLCRVVGSCPPDAEAMSTALKDDHLVFFRNGSEEQLFSRSRMTARESVLLGLPVDINTLTASDWAWFPEIGPKTAAAIVRYRQENDGFKAFEDLQKVPGIGPRKILTLKSKIMCQF